jgi:uncharacterized membrane protein (UPF0127 family)
MNHRRTSIAALFVVSIFAGCDRPTTGAAGDPRAQHLPGMRVQLGSREFLLEVAGSDNEQELGLMYRDPLPTDHGMIFIFPDEQERSFWMRNTKIPLDIIYADRDGKIVAIKPMKPFDLSSVTSEKPAMYAIEVNGGAAATTGLKVGDTIRIPRDIRAAIRAAAVSGNPSTAPATQP